jgi:hypothetical protein
VQIHTCVYGDRMVSAASGATRLPFDLRNTARQTRARFRYQDECVALRCIANLLSGHVIAVVVEWSTDYIALFGNGSVELVSVKHRDPGQGEWPAGELRNKVLRDLHRVWRQMHEACTCAFASNTAVSRPARKMLENDFAGYLGLDPAEAARFRASLVLPDPPLPRRTEITAVAVEALSAVLAELHRDPAHVRPCYEALVDRIAEVALEEPPTPEQRLAALTGSLRAVADRLAPRQDEHTLRLADLRELVLHTHDRLAGSTPPSRTIAVPRQDSDWRGGDRLQLGDARYVIHDPVDVSYAVDRAFRHQRAVARQTAPVQRDVFLHRLDVLRPEPAARAALAQTTAEAELTGRLPGLPAVLTVAADDNRITIIRDLAGSQPLSTVFGGPPYPVVALDALLAGLPSLVHTLTGLHSAGYAHRALHTDALLVDAKGRVRPRDAGLATIPPAPGDGRSPYRAPEQDRPLLQPPGPSTDVYAIAAIVYHLATGQPPGANPPPPSLLRPDLNPDLDTPLLGALATEPNRRPSLTDLAKMLRVAGATVR